MTAADPSVPATGGTDMPEPQAGDGAAPVTSVPERSRAAEKKKKESKDKKKKKKNKGGDKPLGTAKSIETMFRNAYRAELDIISLAAMKANIMISLNGFIISALMISGAFLFAASPELLLPAGIFMLTSAMSIIFALLAASPERVDFLGALSSWLGAVRRGEARLRDLRGFFLSSRESDVRANRNLLIYEDRVRMSRADYWSEMQALLRDHDDVYFKMSDQLYWLGQMANRKFKLLNISYMIFRWGLLVTVVAFLAQRTLFVLFPALTDEPVTRLSNLGISEMKDIFEPSAVQQLPDGRLLVVEDEAARAFSVLSPADDGSLRENPTADLKLIRGVGRHLNDLEGLSIDEAGFVHAITSHSTNRKGERVPAREQLLRFRVEGSNIRDVATVTDLRDRLKADDALIADIEARSGQDFDLDALNIEGLALHEETGRLLLGLRSPLAGSASVILPIENATDLFDTGAAPAFGTPILLDMNGGGVRALSFDPVLEAFLLVNEVDEGDGGRVSQLWTWSGDARAAPQPLSLPGIINLNNVESLDSISIGGEARLIVMSDDGDSDKGRPAKYLMLDYDQLRP